jgi:hypothetical protein
MTGTRRSNKDINAIADHQRHGVWIPAFAGTTLSAKAFFAPRPRLRHREHLAIEAADARPLRPRRGWLFHDKEITGLDPTRALPPK